MTLGLARDQSKVLERCEPKVQPESHIHIPGNVGECEGMNPHTLKWAPTLGVEVSMDSQIFKERFQRSKLIGLKSSLYHWKALEM
jgi:hypothetical protein